MLLFFLIPVLLCYFKKYRLKYFLTLWDFYPVYAAELVHIFFQVTAWFGNYQFVQYAKYLQIAFTLTLLFPILRHRLVTQAIGGSICVVAGSVLNRFAMNSNGGAMPVFPTLSKLTGYYVEGNLSSGIDKVHILMTSSTKLNFLGDYIDLGFCIMSPGDVLIHTFISLVLFGSVKAATLRANKKEEAVETNG